VNYIGESYPTQPLDAVVAPDAKGFLIASHVARELKLPFIPIRKAGKLSGDLIRTKYKDRMNAVDLFHLFTHTRICLFV